jgi:Zn-dependent protease
MAIVGALGLFTSIVLHELAHALAARQQGMPMKGITLFIFGGVAEMDREPPSGKAEFIVAIAGPIASVGIALLCWAGYAGTTALGLPAPVNGVLAYLAWINGLLVAFNMIPAFPLDGGRVLRAAIWHFKGDLRKATSISSQIGSGFGLLLILFGILAFVQGAFVAGMWWFLIGMFLRNAAQMSYQQVIIRRMLEGEKVGDLMMMDPITVQPTTSIRELVEDYVYKHHHKMFPVASNGHLEGCVSTRQVRDVPRQEWSSRAVGDIAERCSPDNTISPEADAMQALSQMNRTSKSRLLVVDHDRLMGIIALKDVLKHLSLRIELEKDDKYVASLGSLRQLAPSE